MPNSTAYEIGRFLGSLPLAAKLALLAILVGVPWWISTESERQARKEAARSGEVATAAAEKASAAKVLKKVDCSAKREKIVAEYAQLISAEKPRDAANSLKPCATLLQDKELLELVRAAEITSHKKAINHPSASIRERIASIDEFTRLFPTESKQFERLRIKLDEQATKEQERVDKQLRQQELVRRKSQGVVIGMSEEEVLQSSWGRPESVNRSVYSFGTREQWVYGSGNYLYFQDGRLTSLQTGGNR